LIFLNEYLNRRTALIVFTIFLLFEALYLLKCYQIFAGLVEKLSTGQIFTYLNVGAKIPILSGI